MIINEIVSKIKKTYILKLIKEQLKKLVMIFI